MSVPEPPKPPAPSTAPRPAADDEGFPVRLVVFGALLVYGVLFAVLNAETVNVSFVVFSTNVSLVLVIVLALVIGFASGYLFDQVRARRKRRKAA